MTELFLDFYGFTIKVLCSSSPILECLKKDFRFFVSGPKNSNLTIDARVVGEIDDKVPKGLRAKRQNTRAMSFELGERRFNYFYGRAVSILDYSRNIMEVYSKDEAYLHEILYLAILSRETKYHDMHGLHKVHAFGIGKGDTALIGMMNMKGGKTTLFSYFIDEKDYELISDDTPLINWRGEVFPFPIRIGYELNSYTKERLAKYQDKSYHFERDEYGPKKLIDLMEFQNPIASKKKRTVLFQGIRVHGTDAAKIEKISKFKMFRYLMKNMVVGVGLPMVLEYYLESGWQGRFKNANILFRRLVAALALLSKSQCYEVYMGQSPESNFRAVKELLDSHEK